MPLFLVAHKDQSVTDSREGTLVWNAEDVSCPDTLTQLYRGDIKVYVNSSLTPSLENGLAVLEKMDQVAGLELVSSFLLCNHAAWRTHIRDVIVVIHGNNFSPVATNQFDPSVITELIRLENEVRFLHIKSSLSQKKCSAQ